MKIKIYECVYGKMAGQEKKFSVLLAIIYGIEEIGNTEYVT